MTQAVLEYNPNTPHTAHNGLAASMYGEIFRNAASVLNVAAGNTDLGADLRHVGINTAVTSLDPMYGEEAQRRPDQITGFAQALPFEDDTFAMTLCQFGVQHMPGPVAADAIREMVRVTRSADGPNDPTKGVVFINPIFRTGRLDRVIAEAGIGDVVGQTSHHKTNLGLPNRRQVMPSLWIQKTDALSSQRLEIVIDAVLGSGALKPTHRTLGEIVSRSRHGYSNV